MGEAYSHSWPAQGVFGAFPKNPEKEQAVLRISLGAVVLLAYLAATVVCQSKDVHATTAVVALYVSFGVATYVATAMAPGRSPVTCAVATHLRAWAATNSWCSPTT
jgi:diguanylate cyclase